MKCIIIFLILWFVKSIDLICNLAKCPDIRKGNRICEPDCMTSYCNFDTLLTFDGQNTKENSDCYEACINFDGCDPEILGNGVCDNSCNTKNCGFDWGDCTCAPDCFDFMLGDGKCDEYCDNWDCDLDNHDCGQCADGCFPSMLGNGICNPECNNENCLYDYKDCQCAEGCLLEDYGKCKPECMVANCNFDRITQYPSNQCQNTSLVIFSSYQQIIRKNFSYVTHLEDCYEASNYNCAIEKAFNFDLDYWYEECNYLECNYANGYQDNSSKVCSRFYNNSHHQACLSCPEASLQQYVALIDENCMGGEFLVYSASVFPDGSLIQIPLNDTSSSKNPHIYFICPDANSNPETGEGTIFSPFQSLTYALHNINYKYSVVYLLDCDGYNLTTYHKSALPGLIGLIESYAFKGKNVKFSPLNSSKIKVQRVMDDNYNDKYWSFGFLFENALSIEISNIIFDWKNTLSTCENDEYCDYCPYVTLDSKESIYYNDKGEIINDFLASDYCKKYEPSEIFIKLKASNLLLKMVDFVNFRTGFNSIFLVNNNTNVTFYDVTFDNIKVSDNYESWVIRWSGTGYGNFKFENGKVTRLNNGYELSDPINTKGFINATGINSIVIRNVEFKNNVIFKQDITGLNIASLISLNIFQSLWIDSCRFLYNLCDNGIIYIQQQLNNYPIEIDDDGIVVYSKINHVHISNSNFTSNYGRSGGVIYSFYKYEGQNFLIENTLFTLNGVERGTIIYISKSYKDTNYLSNSTLNIAFPGGNIKKGKYLAKWVKFQKSNFTRNYAASGLFFISSMINIQWEKLNIDSNGLQLSENMNINSILIKSYIENPLIYAKFYFTSPTSLDCYDLSIIYGIINFNIEAVNIVNNYCKRSLPNIILSSANNTIVKSSYFYNNKGTGNYYGACLAFLGDVFYQILNSEFNSNVNYQSGSPGAVSSQSNLIIHNCTFFNNIGNLYSGGKSLKIFSSHFESNSSPGSNGGAIFISTPLSNIDSSVFFISNTTFANNFCSFSGGAIYIERTVTIDLILKLQIENTDFFNNYALDGSCIYIDSNVQLSSNSLIIDSTFQENIAISSSTVLASYLYGILTFNRCNFVKNTGIYSSGLNIEIGENNEKNPSKIVLNSCIFQYNSGNATISFENANINSTIEANSCIFEYNTGSIFSLDGGFAVVKKSKFQHNFSPSSGGVLNLKNSAIFASEDTIYLNCSSNLNGGIASISVKSQFICFSCTFKYNYAASSGGVIYADSNAQFNIIDSIISKNSCKNKGSAIFMASSLASSSINNTEIYENHAYGDGTVFILSSLFSIFSSKIYRNEADEKNPGLYIDESTIIIMNAFFFNQSGNQGCFIYASTSYVNITNSTFYEGFSNYSGIAIHATSSNVKIFSSTFYYLFSNDTGGIIYLYDYSSLSMKDSKFLNSSSSIDSYLSSVSIENTLFTNLAYTAIYASQIDNLQISSSKFMDSTGINGGTIYCSQCNKISIAESWFIHNLGLYGGAIYITNNADHPETSEISIASSNFQLNSASNGGAIWTNNINLNLLSSIFEGNKAEAISNNFQEIEDGIGGAIKISCQNSNSICYFDILSNTFSNNSASNNGGAINWEDSKPIFDDNYFENNSAEYGPDIASFPTMIIFLKDETRILQSKTTSENRSSLVLNNVASSQKNNPQLAFGLVDDLYQIIATDNTSQAQIQARASNTVISGSSVVYAKNGIYYFSDYIISAEPGSSTYIDIVSSAINTEKMNTSSEILPSFSIEINLRLCEIGEARVGLACEICPEGYYNINASDSRCLSCPSHAICYGNFTIVPKSGYWRDNKFTDKFWKCPYPPACLEAPDLSNLSLTGTCEKGYENNMCHSCQYGYSRLYRNECQACPDYANNIFRWIGIAVLLVFITIVILKTTRNSLFKANSFSSIYIKIFWNYLQIMIIIATYNLNWPLKVIKFFYVQTSLDYIGGQLFSFDCFLKASISKSKIYYTKILFTSLTPFAIGLLCLLFWFIIYKIKKKQIKEMKDDFISVFVVLLFLVHPSIIQTMFSAFSCKEINSGEYWSNVDLGIRCWDQTHIFYAFLLALPTIAIWVVAMPLLCLINLIKNKKYLDEMWMKKRYGFLCNGYKIKHYYWEFMIIFYKVILISCSVFLLNISTNVQALSATLFFVIFLHLHSSNEPFNEIFFNKAETFSRLTSLITILAGLCFLISDLGNTTTWILLVFLILANSLFTAYILTKFFLQFTIVGYIIARIWKIFLSKKQNYSTKIAPAGDDMLDQSYKEIQKENEEIRSAVNLSGKTNLEMSFKENLSISVEKDPFSSMRSIDNLN